MKEARLSLLIELGLTANYNMALIEFSTLNVPLKERIEAAQDVYAAIANIELCPVAKHPPTIETKLRLLPGISIGWVKTSAAIVRRRDKHIQDGNDDFSLLLNPIGLSTWSASIEKIGDISYIPGTGFFSYNDLPGILTFQGAQTNILNISFSRKLFEPLISSIDCKNYTRLDPGIVPLLIRAALDFVDGDSIPSIDSLDQLNQLVDLAALAAGVHPDYKLHARQHGLKQARMKAVKDDILIHSYRGDLSLDWIAKRHGISPSYIRSMFEQEGSSFTEYLLNIRLQKAFDCLQNQQNSAQTVTDIAYNVGFNNPSWFYRAFKQRFQAAPSDIRNLKAI